MEHRTLGKTGLSVSVLGFGAAPVAFLKADQPTAGKMIEALLDSGMNLIDTATAYPGSHEFLGNHLSHRRRDFVLVSKCGQQIPGVDAPTWSEQTILASVDRALSLLKTDRIDVMLLHSCDLATLQKGEAIGALVKAKKAGKISHLGYSGDNEAVAYAAALPEVGAIETSINIVDQKNIDLGLSAAREHNVGVIVKRPIANACWKDADTQPGMYKNYAATYTERLKKMNLMPADLGIDGEPADVWPNVALRFTLGEPGVTTAIVGTTNPANAASNACVAAEGPLPEHIVLRIKTAFKKANPDGSWTGQT